MLRLSSPNMAIMQQKSLNLNELGLQPVEVEKTVGDRGAWIVTASHKCKLAVRSTNITVHAEGCVGTWRLETTTRG